MSRTLVLLISLCVACVANAANLVAADLQVITEDQPPLNYVKEGKPTGPSVEIVQEMQKRVGSAEQVQVLPWARGYDMALKTPNVALFSTTRTDSREKLFKWVGPIATKNWVFYVKKGKNVKINSLDDAKRLGKIATYKNDSKEQVLKEKGFTNLDSNSSDETNVKKLMAGRVDAWITGELDGASLIKAAGLSPSDFEIAFVVDKKELYIAFSLQTPDELVAKWKSAYDAMIKDGSIQGIQKKWLDQVK